MNIADYKAVAFDLDGTLINSEAVNIDSAKIVFARYGHELTPEEIRLVVGMHPRDYIPKLLKDRSELEHMVEEIIAEQKREYSAMLDGSLGLFSGARNAIEHLANKKIPLALVTNSSEKVTDFLHQNNLVEAFSVVVRGSDVEHLKPAPDAYVQAAEKLGLQPGEIVAIEDSSFGVVSAKDAGCRCIVVPNSYTKDQDFSRADIVIASLEEIPTIL